MTLTFLIILTHLFSLHPYYVSIFEIEHSPETKTFQVASRIFIDDLEDALIDEGKADPKIGTPDELPQADEWIAEYITHHFKLTADSKPVELHFLGKETDTDAMWCYFESKAIDQVDTLDVYADLLIELHPTQTNIVHLNIWDTKTSVILRKGRTEKQLTAD